MTFNPTELEQEKLNQGRMLRAEADLIIPMLTKRREDATARLVHYFKSGEHDKLTVAAAEIATLTDMAADIRNKIKSAENIERKIHGN